MGCYLLRLHRENRYYGLRKFIFTQSEEEIMRFCELFGGKETSLVEFQLKLLERVAQKTTRWAEE